MKIPAHYLAHSKDIQKGTPNSTNSFRERFLRLAEHYPVLALVEPRQSGKTTILRHLMKSYDVSYVLFDEPDAKSLFDEDVKKFAMQYMDGYELTVLDEIQYCKDAGQKLKYLADSGYKMWVTSSSELLKMGYIPKYWRAKSRSEMER